MRYEETIAYLYNSAPLFQQVGALAYKPGLQSTITIDDKMGNPHKNYKIIHVGGTNGKGSCASTIAAILQSAGYRVGLYTSPHLVDFRERIRVNGMMIPKERVVKFVEQYRSFFEEVHPSFFEITTALAFLYFSEQKVDVAVVEVGLGGRLDCTNIVNPILSVITNVSLDHTQFLGDNLESIASEKAGIIKPAIPVVVGESNSQTRSVFEEKARSVGADIIFADDSPEVLSASFQEKGLLFQTKSFGEFIGSLSGDYQVLNANTILAVLKRLKPWFPVKKSDIYDGFLNVCSYTGLRGRWEVVSKKPLTIVDAGHNEGGWQYLSKQLQNLEPRLIHIIIGMSSDKDIHSILRLLPTNAQYYFTKASVKRSLNECELKSMAEAYGLKGNTFQSVSEAYKSAKESVADEDFIFVGGSCFIVADFLEYWDNNCECNGRKD